MFGFVYLTRTTRESPSVLHGRTMGAVSRIEGKLLLAALSVRRQSHRLPWSGASTSATRLQQPQQLQMGQSTSRLGPMETSMPWMRLRDTLSGLPMCRRRRVGVGFSPDQAQQSLMNILSLECMHPASSLRFSVGMVLWHGRRSWKKALMPRSPCPEPHTTGAWTPHQNPIGSCQCPEICR